MTTTNTKRSTVSLIFAFFRVPGDTAADSKRQQAVEWWLDKLTHEDRVKLASAIAYAEGIPAEQLDFTPVES